MKKLITLLTLFISTALFAQDITGAWHGLLAFPGGKLRLSFNITKTESGYTATMDSPDQEAKGIPVPTVAFEANTLVLAIPQGNINYKGTFETDGFKGEFTQNGFAIPLNLGRKEVVAEKAKRPQEPVKPYPYYEEEVTFKNDKAGITLAGTLTLPKKEGNFPAVVLISGSGPQNRNEEILGHKTFMVLADYLTKNGIAVLRYDDRGTAASTGDFDSATTNDFATDAAAAFTYLKARSEINKNKIGLIGHSEGGIIAPMVANENKEVAFIVLMAGTAIPGDELMMLQNYLIGKTNGMPEEELNKLGLINRQVYDVMKKEQPVAQTKEGLYTVFNKEMKPLLVSKGVPPAEVTTYIDMQVEEMSSAWYINFIKYDPFPALVKTTCPILALNGDKDVQVASKANLDAVKRAAQKSGNKKVVAKELPGLNHLFQKSETGAPADYGVIEETISPVALAEISNWITQQVK